MNKEITDIKGTWKLNNGIDMPYFGLGVFQAQNNNEVVDAVNNALDFGYRHIDTATIYRNENGVGKAIQQSEINREEIFVTTKVWNNDQRSGEIREAFDTSMSKLGLDYLDLYLIHWPVKGCYKNTWKELEKLYKEGRIKSIGVSNFMKHHLEDLLAEAEIVPMVNQMEFHPYLVQQDLLDYCVENNIQYQSWSPLMQGKVLGIEELIKLANKYAKSVIQLVLRWNLQKGVIVIPKSVHKNRIIDNANVFDFSISEKDIAIMDSLHRGYRTGPDPDDFNF